MRVLVTDPEFVNPDIEADVLGAVGHELRTAQCRTPEDVGLRRVQRTLVGCPGSVESSSWNP